MKRYIEALKYGWSFVRGEVEDAKERSCTFTGFKTVRVPHDYAVEGPYDTFNDRGSFIPNADGTVVNHDSAGRTGCLPIAGTAWYRRVIDIRPEWKGKRISLEFDGVMSHCDIYLNGKHVKKNAYGYTSFEADISDFALFDGNDVLAVRVTQYIWESRWYPGAGIYRNVRLVVRDESSIAYNSVYITTPEVSADKATVAVSANINNPVCGAVLSVTLLDADGNVAAKGEVKAEDKVKLSLELPCPRLWSNADPYLYTAKLELTKDGELLDNDDIRIGVRTLVFDRDKGFFVNGVYTKLKGVCMHHDLGAIGTAVNESALRRQFRILTEMGCNSIRTSHNPPTPELLHIADEMGVYVIVEQFDQWKRNKTTYGYGLYFDEWADFDLSSTIRRDRNHPCVIMWSIGNEIHDQREKDGGKTAQFLTDIAHREDPSRYTTAGFHIDDQARANGLVDAVDIVGWNYRPHRYSLYHDTTNHKIYGSETESCLSSRGVYFIPAKDAVSKYEKPTTAAEMYDYINRPYRRYDNVEIPVFVRPELHVNSYDLTGPEWGYYPEVEFAAQDDHPYIFGEYVWTGFDYIGEPMPGGISEDGNRVPRSSYFGIVDLAGIPKDRYYSYQAKWSDKEVLHPFPHWNWNDGDVLPVHCYSSYDRAELFVNGKSYGIREKNPGSSNALERYRLIWNDVKFEAGEYTVKALDKDGNVVKTATVRTAGAPAKLEISADRDFYNADGDDLCYVTVKVLDKNGNLCPKADNLLHFTCEGAGEFLASDNGDQTDYRMFFEASRNAFSGMAVGIFRSVKDVCGDLKIKVTGDGIEGAEITVKVK